MTEMAHPFTIQTKTVIDTERALHGLLSIGIEERLKILDKDSTEDSIVFDEGTLDLMPTANIAVPSATGYTCRVEHVAELKYDKYGRHGQWKITIVTNKANNIHLEKLHIQEKTAILSLLDSTLQGLEEGYLVSQCGYIAPNTKPTNA